VKNLMAYDEKQHAASLLDMLEKFDPGTYCPAGSSTSVHDCIVCQKFVNINNLNWPKYQMRPCKMLGQEEAIKRTWIALEEKGYLK